MKLAGVQMNCDPPCSEVIDTQYTADDIPPHTVEDQDLPNWISIFIQDRSGLGDQAAVAGLVMSTVFSRTGVMVQVEELLNRGYPYRQP